MSVIKAGTTVTTALVLEGNTDGDLIFKTGSAAVTAMSISASGVVTFPATTGFDIASANITNLTSGTTSATVLRSASATLTNLLATSLNVSAATYLASSSGDVGIATTSPATKLHLGGATDKTIRIDSSNSNAGYYGVYQNQTIVSANRNPSTGAFTDTAKAASYIALNAAAANGFIQFATTASNNTEPTERIRISASGDVGIGTTSPAYKLDVNGGVSINAKSLITASGYFICGSAGFRWNNSTDAFNNVVMNDNGTTGFRNAIGVGLADLGTVTTSGAGVQFPATQSASSNANTLDDYEEGTFDPTFTGETPPTSVTYTARAGRYTKIGRVVFIELTMQLSSKGTGGSGNMLIGNLPFTIASDSTYANFGALIDSLASDLRQVSVQLYPNSSTIYLIKDGGSTTGHDGMKFADITNGTQIRAGFFYTVA